MKIGHKAAECIVQLVGETAEETGKSVGEEETALGVWTVGAVEAVSETRSWRGGPRRQAEEARCEERMPRERTLGDWLIPKKIVLSNKFQALGEECEEEREEELIGETRGREGEEEESEEEGQVGEVVEVTIDSGASRSVWPRRRRGVTRTKGDMGVKLAAANGSPIEVVGEAALHFRRGDRKCAMKFLDADVKRPLGAVSAIVDEGNTVVFTKSGSYIENDTTRERIRMVRKGGVFVIELEAEKPVAGSTGGKGRKGTEFVMGAGAEDGEEVFRRRA